MNLPHFTAEVSLYQPNGHYRTNGRATFAGPSTRTITKIYPTQSIDTSTYGGDMVGSEVITVYGTAPGGTTTFTGGGTQLGGGTRGGGTQGGTQGGQQEKPHPPGKVKCPDNVKMPDGAVMACVPGLIFCDEKTLALSCCNFVRGKWLCEDIPPKPRPQPKPQPRPQPKR